MQIARQSPAAASVGNWNLAVVYNRMGRADKVREHLTTVSDEFSQRVAGESGLVPPRGTVRGSIRFSRMNELPSIGVKAKISNSALKPLEFLLGEWRTTGSHPERAGRVLSGRTSFQWHEGGAFLIMRTQIGEPEFPDGLAIIGSDNVAGTFTMTYFDERGISRVYDMTVGDRTVTWSRDDPKFSQSNTITADASSNTLVGKGRMSKDGGAWGDDLSQVFHREGTPWKTP
jgi:hypothetical protein